MAKARRKSSSARPKDLQTRGKGPIGGAAVDSLGDISEQQQLKMQSTVASASTAAQTLSNIQKSMASTSSTIIGNLK